MELLQSPNNKELADYLYPEDIIIHKAMQFCKKNLLEKKETLLKEYRFGKNAAGQRPIAADQISEELLISYLKKSGLNIKIYSEESGVLFIGEKNDVQLTLLVDPLDGSKNLLKSVPYGCISVAYTLNGVGHYLADLNRAAILNLYADECYFGIKEVGSWYNGNYIKKSVNQEFNGTRHKLNCYTYNDDVKQFLNLFKGQYDHKSLGSVAWELALVSCGKSDALIDIRGRVKAHDFAAGKIILEAAKGKFSYIDTIKDTAVPLGNFTKGYQIFAAQDEELLDSVVNDVKTIISCDSEEVLKYPHPINTK